jgi:uncharacterized protein YndB with AHSA1/START domain
MTNDAQQAVTRQAAVPVQVVWDVLTDFAGISEWAPNVDHSCLLRSVGDDQTEGLDLVRRIQTGRTTLRERVVTWDAPQTLAYELSGLPAVVSRAVNTWTLVPTGPNGTTITLTSGVDVGPRPPQKVVANVIAKVMLRADAQMIDGLVAHVEQRSATTDPTAERTEQA